MEEQVKHITTRRGNSGRFALYLDRVEVSSAHYQVEEAQVQGATVLDVYHTYTNPEYRGQGLAARVTTAVFEYALERNCRVRRTCSYVRDYYSVQQQHASVPIE